MIELWKPVKEYEGLYEVSNTGKIFSLTTKKIRILKICNKGYLYVNLSNKNIVKNIKVHRLVAQAFIPNPFNLPVVNHKDGNKLNNNDWNLEWTDNITNIRHAEIMGLRNSKGEFNSSAKLTTDKIFRIKLLLNNNKTIAEIANMFNVSKDCIWDIRSGRTWSHLNTI